MSPVRLAILTLVIMSVSGVVRAQTASGAAQGAASGGERTWSIGAYADTYVMPGAGNYVQPTVTFDRGVLHLEGRYNYEDLGSSSAFVGWNVTFGRKVTLELTPMIGVVAGSVEGIVPALELNLAWRRLELDAEGEFVVAVGRGNSFLYNWSELSVWATDWFRTGLVTQRTRANRPSLDIQSGLLVGLAFSKVTPTLYVFNPGSEDQFLVASMGVEF